MKNLEFIKRLSDERILTTGEASGLVNKFHGDAFAILWHLLKTGRQSKTVLGKMWGDAIGVAYVDLEKTVFEPSVVSKLPEKFARHNHMIPLYQFGGGNVITVAAADPTNWQILHEAERIMQQTVSAQFALPEDIEDAIDIQYQTKDSLDAYGGRVVGSSVFESSDELSADQLRKLAGDQAVVELIEGLLLLGIKERASDIHIETHQNSIHIRFRIDGLLQPIKRLEKDLFPPIVSRLKILANLDITEKRRPQDGRIHFELRNRTIMIRFSSIPTIYGEKVVLRILGQDQARDVPKINALSFSKTTLEAVSRVIRVPSGIFFLTGPTGSGKTTTLFSIIQEMNKPGMNILTVEDPVEYRLSGINQVQVNPAIGLSFAGALRSFLRQDPDIILVGEIRDLETATIASQAALTGHIVLASLHTNTAAQVATRLIDIGVPPHIVAPALIGAMGQRLVRRICDNCKEPYHLSKEEARNLFEPAPSKAVTFFRGKGCRACNDTGYAGRLAIHEVIIFNETMRSMVVKQTDVAALEREALRSGYRGMRYDGLKKVLRGLTTIDEINRVSYDILA
jgi:type IV pilus assembly protein PilB